MPGGAKKFTVRYDSLSGRYWSLVNYVTQEWAGKQNPAWVRNTLALSSSPNLQEWTVHRTVLHHPDIAKHGFQYATGCSTETISYCCPVRLMTITEPVRTTATTRIT